MAGYWWNGTLAQEVSQQVTLDGGLWYQNVGLSLSRDGSGVWHPVTVQTLEQVAGATGFLPGGRRVFIPESWATELTSQGFGSAVDQRDEYNVSFSDTFLD